MSGKTPSSIAFETLARSEDIEQAVLDCIGNGAYLWVPSDLLIVLLSATTGSPLNDGQQSRLADWAHSLVDALELSPMDRDTLLRLLALPRGSRPNLQDGG